MIVPGGGINTRRHEWRKLKGHYLFNGFALVSVFRAKLCNAIGQAGLSHPNTPEKWVVQCQRVGQGLSALKDLSRYLYRGVISHQRIVNDDGEYVTFEYTESGSNVSVPASTSNFSVLAQASCIFITGAGNVQTHSQTTILV